MLISHGGGPVSLIIKEFPFMKTETIIVAGALIALSTANQSIGGYTYQHIVAVNSVWRK